MTGLRQLRALLALRWQMLRTRSAKAGAVAAAALAVWLVQSALGSGAYADDALVSTVLEVSPGIYLGFALLALIAPLTAGGGHEVFPHDQLVAYPIRPVTQFFGGLLLAPINLVWAINLLVLVAVTSMLTLGDGLPLAMVTTTAYVAAATVTGQALAWLIVGARQTQTGRRVVTACAAGLAVGTPLALEAGLGSWLLNSGPGLRVVLAVIAGGGQQYEVWVPTTAAFVLLTALAAVLGVRACGWALRRSSDVWAVRSRRAVRRRRTQVGPLRTLIAVDRASAWRAPALRRGGIVIMLLPGLLVATFELPWESLVVMPGLVAAGAGLLFGINAFALDSSGAVWLASLPSEPRLALLSKGIVVSETVLASVGLAALVGALRASQTPTGAQVAAMVGAALACSAVVVALCLRASTRRPARADLRGPRDAVAAPGALATASVRLALPCTGVAVAVAASAQAREAWFPLLVASPFVLLAVLSLLRTERYYADPGNRAKIVHAVASG